MTDFIKLTLMLAISSLVLFSCANLDEELKEVEGFKVEENEIHNAHIAAEMKNVAIGEALEQRNQSSQKDKEEVKEAQC